MNILTDRWAIAQKILRGAVGGLALLFLLSACATSPPVPIRSLTDIAGTWEGRSTYGVALKVVVTGYGADFYFDGAKKAMGPPTIEADGTVKMHFTYDPNGFIRLTRGNDGKTVETVYWYYKGGAGESNSVLVAAAGTTKGR